MASLGTLEVENSQRGPPQTLKISPNLNLLAEHDERMRQLSAGLVSPSSTSSFPASPSPTGLPPPPRGPRRKVRSPSITGIFQMQQSGSVPNSPQYAPESNPYINEAPKFDNLTSLSPELALKKLPTNGSSESPDGGQMLPVNDRPSDILSSLPPGARRFEDSEPPSSPPPTKKRSKLTKDKRFSSSPSSTPNNTLPRRSRLPSHSSSRSSFSFIPTHSPTGSLKSNSPRSEVVMSGSRIQPRSPQSVDLQRRSSDSRNSFIDLSSPGSHELSFPPPTRSHSARPSPRNKERSPMRSSTDGGSQKPPLPTSPKPDFSYLNRLDKDNQLSSSERAELVERSRKLAKIFGETPGAADFARRDPSKRSMDSGPRRPSGDRNESDDSQYVLINSNRRHSSPFTSDSFSLKSDRSGRTDTTSKHSSSKSKKQKIEEPSSPMSFMSLSEDEDSPTTPKKRRPPRASSLTPSALESLSPEERAEEERKIKRDRLAKLHRFLGSRVPANLVLGTDPLASLPSPAPHSGSLSDEVTPTDEPSRKAWIRRRRRSSIAAFPADYGERVKEDLDMKEKAINVRRAQKMEKVFGVAPPQTLYHTRQAPSTSIQIPTPSSPTTLARSWSDSIPSPTLPNPNQSSYSKKSRNSRPSPSDSTEGLIPKDSDENAPLVRPRRGSVVYSHYQHSLNSLNDIIDRDDVQSLASLREYLETDMTEPPPRVSSSDSRATDEVSFTGSRRSSTLSERRRSMPPVSPSARNSFMSFASYELSPDVDTFQARRRKATKLTQFFGVDYRDVIRDVLDSFEAGLEHDQKRGTLNAEEAEDLRRALRNLKSKRDKTF